VQFNKTDHIDKCDPGIIYIESDVTCRAVYRMLFQYSNCVQSSLYTLEHKKLKK